MAEFDYRAEARFHAFLIAQRLIELQRIDDFITREAVDDETLLVGGGDLLRLAVEIENALVVDLDRVDQRYLPVEARRLHDALWLTEAQHERLLVLMHDERRGIDRHGSETDRR